MTMIVIYAGGFQPFHQGHLSSYIQAKSAFPNADFYVATSADVKNRPIPYEDKKFLAGEAGVESDDFPNIVVASPLNPKEILTNYNSDKDIFILVRSERDPVAYTKKDGTPGYYQPFIPGEKLQPFSKHGYVFVTKKKDFDVNGQDVYSGTQVRNMYLNADDTGRKSIIAQLYPKSKQQKKIKQILDTYIGTEFVPPAKNLKENLVRLIQQVRPLLKEANAEQKIKLLKLIKEAHSGALMEGSLNEDPVTQFASKAHDVWRKNFDPTGTKERIKKNSDGSEGNINVPFEKLHPDWKKENLAAGQAAMIAVNKFPRDIEQAAEYIHNEWMKRNPLADYNAAQHVPYDQLPEDEKEKDRVHVRTMMSLSGQQGMTESKSLTKKVKIVKGPDAGKTGWIREIKHGAFKGAPKTYYVDLDDGGQANNLPGTALRLVKDNDVAEAAYPGNIGIMELAKFFDIATLEEKTRFKQLMNIDEKNKAWKLIQQVTGVKLQGKEFAEQRARPAVVESSEQAWEVSFSDAEDVIKVHASSKQEAIYKATQIAKSQGNPYPSVDWARHKEPGVMESSENIEISDDKSIVTISVDGKERFVLQPAEDHKPKSYGGRAYKYWTIYDIERKKNRINSAKGMMSKNQAIAYVKKLVRLENKSQQGLAEGSLADAAKHVKKGALHKQEHIPLDKKIGATKLKSLKAHGTPLERKRANFALNIQGIKENAVADLEHDMKPHSNYTAIDHLMKYLAAKHHITPEELHDKFVNKHGIIPDEWIKHKPIAEADEVPNYDRSDELVRRLKDKAAASKELAAQGKKPETRLNPKTGKYYVDFNVKESGPDYLDEDPFRG